uniref:Uncharacterized protein n=1 Tax=Corethron hystrix TaxID=216773 RepID=A0A7S1BY50_9STRA|mmetsp:Transcript_43214/g.101333  ORF Transcript_43214/g.101333 Transcript_43214/m.101333 type:complete len:584 (+) Transcript_43214:154-1905(+)
MIGTRMLKCFWLVYLFRSKVLLVDAQANGWNIERPTATSINEDGQLKLEIEYSVGTAASDATSSLKTRDCLESIVSGDDDTVTIETSTLFPGVFSLSVDLDKSSISTSSLTQLEAGKGNSAGTISFCIRVDLLEEEDLSVSFHRENFDINFDLTQSTFSITQSPIKLDLNDLASEVDTDYAVIACQCGVNSSELQDCLASPTPVQMGGMVALCIYPDSPEVLISNFDMQFKKLITPTEGPGSAGPDPEPVAQKMLPIVVKGTAGPEVATGVSWSCLTNTMPDSRRLAVSEDSYMNQPQRELVVSGPTLSPTFYPTTELPTASQTQGLFDINSYDTWYYEPWGSCYVRLIQGNRYLRQIWIVSYSDETNNMKVRGRTRSRLFLQGQPSIRVKWQDIRRIKMYATMLDSNTIKIEDISGGLTYMYRDLSGGIPYPSVLPSALPTACPESLQSSNERKLSLSAILGDGDHYKIVSRAVTELFIGGSEGFNAEGEAYLVFKNTVRRNQRILASILPFESMREMQELEDEGGRDVPYSLPFSLGRQETTARSSSKISFSALILYGGVALFIVLIICVKKKKCHTFLKK